MYKDWWERSDGALLPSGAYDNLEEAKADAMEPASVPSGPAFATLVTDSSGEVVFSTAVADAQGTEVRELAG